MKLKITRIEEIEVPDNYPIYRKSATLRCHYWMVFNARQCVSIYVGEQCSIQISDISNAYYDYQAVNCEQEEFEFAFTEVMERLRETANVEWMKSINHIHGINEFIL